jgi:hypothetical protein
LAVAVAVKALAAKPAAEVIAGLHDVQSGRRLSLLSVLPDTFPRSLCTFRHVHWTYVCSLLRESSDSPPGVH